jgi:Flp pilus assembly protein TadG
MKPKLLNEGGQALILIAFGAIALFGITGLAIDGSNKYSDRRHAQNAADAAALAGALARATELTTHPGLSDSEICPNASPGTLCQAISVAALDRALDNGYDNNLLTNDVKVYTCNNPDSSCGPYAGNKDYVQVVITSKLNTYFMRVLGINQTQNVVQAVALAGRGGVYANGASVVSMDPDPNCGNGSFNVGGNGEIHLTGGGMFVNSSASCGYSQTSCSVILTMNGGAGISSAGSPIDQSCGIAAPENTGAQQIMIPDEVYMPERPTQCSMTAPTPTPLGGKDWLIHPGYYTDFPQAGLISANMNIHLEPGVYCVDHDIHWSGSTFDLLDGASGGGVTIYITPGHDFSFNINSPIRLDASASGDYQGFLIILDGNPNTHPNCTINGGSYLTLKGTIFAPYCNITINGDNTTISSFNAQIIGWDVKLNGGNVINIQYDPADNAQLKRRVGLMK